ncbi:hypothetical protein HK104_008597 [Borealophlyctis nickersoniae]|nr:hypothetical protein HK104_008597 [Borealophlyctis nickersoniae]
MSKPFPQTPLDHVEVAAPPSAFREPSMDDASTSTQTIDSRGTETGVRREGATGAGKRKREDAPQGNVEGDAAAEGSAEGVTGGLLKRVKSENTTPRALILQVCDHEIGILHAILHHVQSRFDYLRLGFTCKELHRTMIQTVIHYKWFARYCKEEKFNTVDNEMPRGWSKYLTTIDEEGAARLNCSNHMSQFMSHYLSDFFEIASSGEEPYVDVLESRYADVTLKSRSNLFRAGDRLLFLSELFMKVPSIGHHTVVLKGLDESRRLVTGTLWWKIKVANGKVVIDKSPFSALFSSGGEPRRLEGENGVVFPSCKFKVDLDGSGEGLTVPQVTFFVDDNMKCYLDVECGPLLPLELHEITWELKG